MTRGGISASVLLLGVVGAFGGDVQLSGRVSNETGAPLGGVKLTVRATGAAEPVFHAYTDLSGKFSVAVPAPGEYVVDVGRAGYFPLHEQAITLFEGDNRADFTLNRVREVFESIEVVATPPPIDMDTTVSQETVTGTEILNIPYPSTNNLKSALRIIPGVMQDSRGRIHINGAQEEQALYTLNGFNVTDPLTGRFDSRVSVEAVQTVDVTGGFLPAEYGKGSAGVLAVHTRSGDDTFRVSATNFFPGIEYRKGLIIGNWTPRFNFSGPIKKGRAWFSDSFDTQYTKSVIEDLPRGEDRSESWRMSNHLTAQVNLSPANILYGGFLVNAWTAPRDGLSALDPRETTVDRRSRQWFFHLKDQIYFREQWLLEVGFAVNRTFGREIPQGQDLYQITPDGRRGNFFVDATRKSSRDQVLANLFAPSFDLWGEHRLKGGIDLNRLWYWQNARRTGIENYGPEFIRTRRILFGGSGLASLANYEASLYVQDSWKLRPNLIVEGGIRGDWDQILHYWTASPRIGVAWSPPGRDRTKISGGYGTLYDATNLRVFTRPLDQYSLTTYFDENGLPSRGPAVTVFTIQSPRYPRPRYRSYSIALDQEFGGGVQGRFEYLRKRGSLGFTYINTIAGGRSIPAQWANRFRQYEFDAIYGLTNDRRDKYDSFRVTVRQAIRRKYEWLVSYTRSRALSNAVVDINIDDPILVDFNVGPMPWDSPHRVVSWGYLPTPFKKWAVAYLLEWRTGFPFSIVDDDGRVLGAVNQHRFPNFFELNLHLERRFAFRHHLWAFRMGCNNITNHSNPNVVNNNASSRHFMQFFGGADRSFNFRLRWLGRS